MSLEIVLIIYFVIIVIYGALRFYFEIRKRRIDQFNRHCLYTIMDKSHYPYTLIYGITEEEYIDRELAKYHRKKPSIDTMLFSTKKLTIENWFSLEDQRYLFGLPVNLPHQTSRTIESEMYD